MNTCKPNRGTKTAVVGGLCGFGLPAALLLLAAAAFGNLSAPLRLAALGGGLLLAVLLSAAVYWTLYVVPPLPHLGSRHRHLPLLPTGAPDLPPRSAPKYRPSHRKDPMGPYPPPAPRGGDPPLPAVRRRHRDAVRLLRESGLWQSDL